MLSEYHEKVVVLGVSYSLILPLLRLTFMDILDDGRRKVVNVSLRLERNHNRHNLKKQPVFGGKKWLCTI